MWFNKGTVGPWLGYTLYWELFTCLCGGTSAWMWWHRSGQKAPLTILSDKQGTRVHRWHTSHVLFLCFLRLYSNLFKQNLFDKIFPPFDPSCCVEVCAPLCPSGPQPASTCSVYRLYNSVGRWCAGVGVRVCIIGTSCRYETPTGSLRGPAASLQLASWTQATSHP